MTKAEKQYMNSVAELGCIVCLKVHGVYSPACIHHLTGLEFRAMGKKADNKNIIPLCQTHHQGLEGIHTLGTRAWERKYGSQKELLKLVQDALTDGTALRLESTSASGIADCGA